MMVTQTLSSGIKIRQNYRDSVRPVFFETDDNEWKYVTNGGSAFIINFHNKLYALTCNHVMSGFDMNKLVIINKKMPVEGGQLQWPTIAGLKGWHRPTNQKDHALDSDVNDLCLIEFSDDVSADSFENSSYIIDSETVGSSDDGNILSISGALKDKTEIQPPNIVAGIGVLTIVDRGIFKGDIVLRIGKADFHNNEFDRIVGISGSPVFNLTKNVLSGMVVRGGMAGNACTVYYIDMLYIMEFLKSIR